MYCLKYAVNFRTAINQTLNSSALRGIRYSVRNFAINTNRTTGSGGVGLVKLNLQNVSNSNQIDINNLMV